MLTQPLTTILANEHVDALSLAFSAEPITASAGSRTMAGTLVRYGVPGRTNRGLLRVRPGALRFHDNIRQTILTREHDRATSRGVLAAVYDGPELMRVQVQASAGPDGDAALQEANDGSRAAFSFDVVDATIVGDEITDALVIAIGQVGIPAYDDARIDSIAASTNPGVPMLTEAQRARLNELLAINNRDAAQQAEFTALMTVANGGTPPAAAPETPAAAPAAAPAQPAAANAPAAAPAAGAEQVAASMPAVPAGVPGPAGGGAVTTPRPGAALQQMVTAVTAALQPGGGGAQAITAALSDITHGDHTETIEPVAWSGELWSGLQYVPQFLDLFNSGTLTYWEGKGWRFTSKLEIADYAGDKAEIPTDDVTTESSSWEAARMAVGVDIDRKFYDFPNAGFVNSLFEQVRESWTIKLDAKVKAYATTKAVPATRGITVTTANGDATVEAPANTFKPSDVGATISGAGIPANTTILSVTDHNTIELSANATATATITATMGVQEPTILKAAARVGQSLVRRRVGKPSWMILNDDDMFTLMDIAQDDLPAFLKLWGVTPENFRSSVDVAPGKILGGVKQAAEVKTLPGSPIRVSAQDLAHGGVDEAFFGYWAIEEHHKSGITSVVFKPAG